MIPEKWLDGNPKRIIVHWTAGSHKPSEIDREHYHILIDSDGRVYRGDHSISDNGRATGDYAAHTKGCNSGSIGVALCGMLGAVEEPFNPGLYPITQYQWNNALVSIAELCRHYSIKPEPKTLLMHCEVEKFLKKPQNGKWDISKLMFNRGVWKGVTPGDEMRARVKIILEEHL